MRGTFGLVFLATLGACQPRYGDETVSMRMAGTPADATVIVDDRPIGSLGRVIQHGVALPPGRHHITVERAGYFPWDRAVDARDELIRLEVKLERIPVE